MSTLPLAEVRANLSKLVEEAVRTHERIEVTSQGRRAAVILSADDFDSIMETLAILSGWANPFAVSWKDGTRRGEASFASFTGSSTNV